MSEEKEYSKHPEWSRDYPAIDGIAKLRTFRTVGPPEDENFIRGDMRRFLEMGDGEFRAWYLKHRGVVEKLCGYLEMLAEIPNLKYAGETREKEKVLGCLPGVAEPLSACKTALDYLDKIKEFREYSQEE